MSLKNVQHADAVPREAKNLRLSDLIDVPVLTDMLSDFYDLTGITLAILDMEGDVLIAIGWQDICVKFHRAQPESCRFCHESDASLSRCVTPGAFKLYRCKNNLWDMVTPIMLGATHIGNLFIGQFLYDDEEVDYALFREQARRFGYDEAAYMAALERVPRFSKKTVNAGMSFCSKLAQVISIANYSNVVLKDAVAERELLQEVLLKRVENLREANSYLDNLFTYANAPIIVWDTSYTITRFNKAFEALTGRSAAEVIGHNSSLLFPADQVENSMSLIKRALGGERWETVEIQIRHVSGTVSTLLWNSATIYTNDGTTPVATIAQGYDITTRRQAEAEIHQLNAELERKVVERTAQLRAASEEMKAFAYSVSHDLRAPLRSIDGFSLALLEDCADRLDEEGKDYLRRVRLATQKMAQLIDDILRLSRITRSELSIEAVNLSDMVASIAEELQGAERQRQVAFVIQEDVVAQGDPRLLKVALDNLIGNAWKFTSAHAAARIEFGCCASEGKTVYFVRDDGAGFDMHYADKLFNTFQRLHTEQEFPGTGIGLALVQQIIHRHGGMAWAEGTVEAGATFYFTLKG